MRVLLIAALCVLSLTAAESDQASSRGHMLGPRGNRRRPKSNFDNRMYPQLSSRPVVGVLTVPTPSHLLGINGTSYIPASYVKWLEQSGVRVVPLVFNHPWPELESQLAQLNGVAFPGGNVTLWDSGLTPYAQVACAVFQSVKSQNDAGVYMPIWGTASGMHLLHLCASRRPNTLRSLSGLPSALRKLQYGPQGNITRIFSQSSVAVNLRSLLFSQEMTMFHFTKGVRLQQYKTSRNISFEYAVVATVVDSAGANVVAIIEGRKYPFYGVLFQPERCAYEWNPRAKTLHTREAVEVASFLSLFFANEARRCDSYFDSEEQLSRQLIYNWRPQVVQRYDTVIYGFR